MSDHSLVYVHRKISIPHKPKIINTRQFKHYNVEAYKQDLAKVLQNECKEKFLLVADMHASLVTRRVWSEHVPWLTSEIMRKIYDRGFFKEKNQSKLVQLIFMSIKKLEMN